MIKIEDFPMLSNNITTLQETSKDDHDGKNRYITHLMLEVVNFDSVKNDYIKNLHLNDTPTSNDALYIGNKNHLVFIEFKNGHIDQKVSANIRRKIYDSIAILTDIIGKGISFTRYNLDYILVYNEDKNIKENINKHIMNKSREKIIKFGLDRFKNFFFKDVYTLNDKEFSDFILNLTKDESEILKLIL